MYGLARSRFSTWEGLTFLPPAVIRMSFLRSTSLSARSRPLADVAGRQLALAVQRPGRVGVTPVSSEKLRRGQENLAISVELDRHVRRDDADVAGRRIRASLARHERATGLRLAVRLAEIDAPRLPERGDGRRQRRPARDPPPDPR